MKINKNTFDKMVDYQRLMRSEKNGKYHTLALELKQPLEDDLKVSVDESIAFNTAWFIAELAVYIATTNATNEKAYEILKAMGITFTPEYQVKAGKIYNRKLIITGVVKETEHYLAYCKELNLDHKNPDNLKKFIDDDRVYISEDGELFIDEDLEMNYWATGLYYHDSQQVNEGSGKDALVDVTFYRKLEYKEQ